MKMICRPAGIHDNDEVALLSAPLFRLLDKLIDLAAAQAVWGLIPAMPARNLAFRLRTTAYVLERGLGKLGDRGLLARRDDGSLWVTLFDDPDGAPALAPPAPAPAAPAGQSRSTHWRHKKKSSDAVSSEPVSSPVDAVSLPVSRPASAVSPAVSNTSTTTSNDVSRPASDAAPAVPPGVSSGVSGAVSPRGRVGDVNVQTLTSPDSEDCFAISSSSETLTSNVAAGAGETPDRVDETPDETPGGTKSGETKAVPPTGGRTSVKALTAVAERDRDVRAVIHLTGDDGSRGRWVQIWKHLNGHGALHLWDEGVGIIADRIKSGPPPPNRGASLNRTFANLCRDAGIPIPQGSAAERAEAQDAVGDLRRQWHAEGESGDGGGPQGVPA